MPGNSTPKRKKLRTLAATLLTVAGLVVVSAAPASAVVADPYYSVGRGSGPSYVYYTTFAGQSTPVYQNSMPSFPSNRQFAGLRNSWGSNRFIVTEYHGVAGGVGYCARPGQIIWHDSGTSKSWVASHPYLHSCTPGQSFRVS
jgi:hypothetical protein